VRQREEAQEVLRPARLAPFWEGGEAGMETRPEWIRVTTPVQLFYHLECGEVVAWRLFGGRAFLTMEPGGTYRVVLHSWFGSACEMETRDAAKVRKMFEELGQSGTDFWVCPGAALAEDKGAASPGREGLPEALRWIFRRKPRGDRS
jgi:hypothetical protein